MKKKWITMMLAVAMTLSFGAFPVYAEEETAVTPTAVTTVGPEDGTKFEMWSFSGMY